VAFSAIPFFGIVLIFISTFAIAIADVEFGKARGWLEPPSKLVRWLEVIFFLLVIGFYFYNDNPMKWLIGSIAVASILLQLTRRLPLVREWMVKVRHLYLSFTLVIFLLAASFGYGLTHAEFVKQEKKANVRFTLATGTEEGRFAGKLGGYYFYLSEKDQLTQLPSDSIKRIEYFGTSHTLW
jgi:hypothetical protein